jgi:hypothetical protein
VTGSTEQIVVGGQQLVAAAGDRHVDVVQQGQQFPVLAQTLQVADQNDLVHALVGEPVNLGLHDLRDLGEHADVARAGDRGQQRGGRTDDADVLAPLLDHGAGHDRALVDQCLQPWFVADVQVGRDERWGVRPEPGDEVGQDIGTEVELVVADRHGVVSHGLQRQRVVVGHTLAEARRELRPGQKVVAGGEHHDPPVAGAARRGTSGGRLVPELVEQRLESGYPAEVGLAGRVDQLRLAVVVVQDRQCVRHLVVVVVAAGVRHAARGDDRHHGRGGDAPHGSPPVQPSAMGCHSTPLQVGHASPYQWYGRMTAQQQTGTPG